MPATIDNITGRVTQAIRFEIATNPDAHMTGGKYMILRNGDPLRDHNGNVRDYTTRNGARKRISRERKQNFR